MMREQSLGVREIKFQSNQMLAKLDELKYVLIF